MKKQWIIIIIALAAALASVALWVRPSPDGPLDHVGSVSIAASLTISPVSIWIAQDKGFFQRAGLTAEVKKYSSGKTTTEGMLKGEADLSASAEFLAMRKSFKHKELRILAAISFVHQIKFIGLKERGIATPADLKGKKVGVRLGTNGEYFLARLLTLNGMQRDDIVWVNLKPQAMSDALAEGRVDGVLIWPPFVQKIITRLGDRAIVFDGQPGQDYYYLLLTREEWLAAHPLIADRVVLALKWASDWIAEHPREALTYITEKFNVDSDRMAEALTEYRFTASLPQALLTALEAETRWLVEQGTVSGERVENYLDLINPTPLRKAAPSEVTIIW